MKQCQVVFMAFAFCLITTRVLAFNPLFEVRIDYFAGDSPFSVYATDLDGDGDSDLAVANFESDNVSILRNNGNGTFAAAVNYGVGDGPRSVCASDLDSDGDYDLAVANRYSNNVSILRNNGDGTFAVTVNYGAGYYPWSVYATDLDGDGDSDLAVANYGANTVSILKNNGDGTFGAAMNYGVGSLPSSVCAADLDGDGDSDLAVANCSSDNVSILRNNGDGTFGAAVNYGAGDLPYSVYATDLDGDGDSDLAVANVYSDNVSIFRNNGDGTFAAAVHYGAGDNPISVYATDLDSDGDSDLSVATYNSDNVSILLNNGDGTFGAAVNYAARDYPCSVYATDLDGDGDSDLAVANGNSDNVSIFRNNGDGTFGAAVNYGVGDGPRSVCASDLDSDGDSDLAVSNSVSDNVSILLNNGDGTFGAAVNYSVGSNPGSVCAADLDGDGDSDLAVAITSSDNVSILLNNGDGTFGAAVNYGVGVIPSSICATDIDSDGDSDLAVSNSISDNVSILRNNGNGTFAAAVNYGAGDGPYSVYATDLDGDGDSDLAVANFHSDNVSILRNNGNGTFAAAVNYGAGDGPYSVHATDLDGDGDSDLAVANFHSDNVSILRNNGNGTFASAVNYGAGDGPQSVFASDLDEDGDSDLAVANRNSDDVSILQNNGDGTFGAAVNYGVYGTGECPWSVYATDLDGDGDSDLAVANYYHGNVSILINISSQPTSPRVPSNLAAQTISTSEIDLTWQDESSEEGYFELWRKTGVQGTWSRITVLPSNSESWANTGLVAGANYYYRVRACNGAGCSAWSNTVTAMTGSIPAAPSHLVALPNAFFLRQIDLAWQRNSTNEKGFKIERKLGEAGQWMLIAQPGAGSGVYADCQFAASGTYYYRIRAYNEAGNSGYSPEASATMQGAPGTFSANVTVLFNGVPQQDARVYIDYIDDRGGLGYQPVGLPTNDDGQLPSGIELKIGDLLRADKMMHPAEAQKHQDIEPTMWELWMNSDEMGPNGDYEAVLVSEQRDYQLDLDHPIFKYNLVVSVEGSMDDSYHLGSRLTTAFKEASKYLYNVTDGYVMFGKVKCFDYSNHWEKADMVVEAKTGDVGLGDVANGIDAPETYQKHMSFVRKIKGFGLLWLGWLPDEGYYYRAIAHEFGHYALGFLDEYRDGKGHDAFISSEFRKDRNRYPEVYGFMDHTKLLGRTTEQSSWNEYPEGILYPGGHDFNTQQIFNRSLPCWEYMERKFEEFFMSEHGLTIDIEPPIPGYYPASVSQHHQRLGPTSCPYETIVEMNPPVPGLVSTNLGDLGASTLETYSFASGLSATENGSPLSGASVYRRSDSRLQFLGKTDISGRLELMDLRDSDHVRVGRRGPAGADFREMQAVPGALNLSFERDQFSADSSLRSSLSDARAPGAAVDVEIEGTLAQPVLRLRIWPDEELSSEPSVSYSYGSHSGQVSVTTDPEHDVYTGVLNLDMSDTTFYNEGALDIALADTALNTSAFVTEFELTIAAANELGIFSLNGFNLNVMDGDITSWQWVVMASSGAVPFAPPGFEGRPVTDVFSAHLLDNDAFASWGSANAYYDEAELHGLDQTSLVLFKWLPDSLKWVPADSSVVGVDYNVVSASVSSGGIYCVFATHSTTDSIPPGMITDFAANMGWSHGAIELEWTATGDDLTSGAATEYVLAFSDSAVTDSVWGGLPKISGLGAPAVSGSRELRTIAVPLSDHNYYLGIRASDEAGNLGPISNVTYAISGVSDPNFLPGAPHNLRAIDAPSDSGTAIKLTWDRSYDDSSGKETVTRYKIYRSPANEYAFTLIDSVPAGCISYFDSSGVAVGKSYGYRVSAADSVQEALSYENKARVVVNVGVPTGDFTSDAVVGIDDFSYFVDTYAVDSTYAEFEPLYDLNRDGQIYAADFDSVEAHFGDGGLPLPDSAASNASTNVRYRWVHVDGSTWHLNIICTSVIDMAGYSLKISYDGSPMTLGGVTPDSVGTGNNLLNARGGQTPLFLIREGNSAVTIANVIKGAGGHTAASGSGFLANLIFNCSSPGAISVVDIVVMDSEKRLSVVDHATAVSENPAVPRAYVLYPNYPNPFNPSTTIKFDLPVASKVVLRVYDVAGREVATLANRRIDGGQHAVVWNGKNKRGRIVASGVYFCRLEAGKFVATRKLVMLR